MKLLGIGATAAQGKRWARVWALTQVALVGMSRALLCQRDLRKSQSENEALLNGSHHRYRHRTVADGSSLGFLLRAIAQ